MTELRSLLLNLNQKVKTSGNRVIASAESLNKVRHVRHNISITMHLLKEILAIFELFQKILDQVDSHRYFSALKSINILENDYLSRYNYFEFCHQIRDQLPTITLSIRDAVRAEFSSWLTMAKGKSKGLGALAMTLMDSKLKKQEKQESRRRKRRLAIMLNALIMSGSSGKGSGSSGGGKKKTNTQVLYFDDAGDGQDSDDDDEDDVLPSSPIDPTVETKDGSSSSSGSGEKKDKDGIIITTNTSTPANPNQENLFERIDLSFASVYQCLHVHEALGLSHVFYNMYRGKRLAQALQAVELPPTVTK